MNQNDNFSGISVMKLNYANKWDYWKSRFFGFIYVWAERHLEDVMIKTIDLNLDSIKARIIPEVDILDELSSRFDKKDI
jgi:hypothetical protein